MYLRVWFVSCLLVAATFYIPSTLVNAQSVAPLCQPTMSDPVIVASATERAVAGNIAEPPLTDLVDGFAWPDTPIGVLKSDAGYEFFASDGGLH